MSYNEKNSGEGFIQVASFLSEIMVNKPVEMVFSEVSNPENGPYFFDQVIEVNKLTEDPIGPGVTYRETRQVRGFKIEAKLEIITYEPNKQYSIRNEPPGLNVIYDYEFSPTENGTSIKFKARVKTKGIRNLIMKPIIVNILKKEDGNHLENIKKYVEALS